MTLSRRLAAVLLSCLAVGLLGGAANASIWGAGTGGPVGITCYFKDGPDSSLAACYSCSDHLCGVTYFYGTDDYYSCQGTARSSCVQMASGE